MKRISTIFATVAAVLSLLTLLTSLMHSASVQAEGRVDPEIRTALMIDSSASMDAELAILSNAYANLTRPLTETVISTHLMQFRDLAQYDGTTMDEAMVGNWLNKLNAAGGGDCPDGGLRAMQQLARLELTEPLTATLKALLISDAAPAGRRTHLVNTARKLMDQDIALSVLQSGWCDDANISARQLKYVTMFTGGSWYQTDAANYFTDTQIALTEARTNAMVTGITDMIMPDEIIEHVFEVDSSIKTIEVSQAEHEGVWCLTCTRQTESSEIVSTLDDVQVELIAPNGTVVDAGVTGYRDLHSENYRLQGLTEPLTATWKLRISGHGMFDVRVHAVSDIDINVLGQRALPVNRPNLITADLGLNGPLTATFKLITVHGGDTMPVELFDDGRHQDGKANDGVYGGMVKLPHIGKFWLGVEGVLANGEAFERIDHAPIIGRNWNAQQPAPKVGVAGDARSTTFSISNNETTARSSGTTFELEAFSEMGWAITNTVPATLTLMPGETVDITVDVVIPADAAVGAVEEVRLALTPTDAFGAASVTLGEISVVDSYRVRLPLIIR